jgi:hypothetical protein
MSWVSSDILICPDQEGLKISEREIIMEPGDESPPNGAHEWISQIDGRL